MLQLTPYQSASNSSVDGLTSADFEKSLEQLNKPEVKEFKLFLQHRTKRLLKDFPRMV